MLSSSSDLSSADESSNFSRRDYKIKNESRDAPLALVSKKEDMGKVFIRDENSNSASDKSEMLMSRADGARVRIMEGGFESNETYTYVRGRGMNDLKININYLELDIISNFFVFCLQEVADLCAIPVGFDAKNPQC
jgi:hypothetical protein